MPLTPHTKLGQYEVVESIGAGGMGEVYRARDTKLGRDVAIKVLPEEFARDRERLDRFEREARLLAQLNHANIATLHGLEEHDGQQFLVMELVEGETLAERIAQRPLPLEEAIPLFIQIAEGLEAAHEKGIIHRDLKPANIKIGPDGKPKILDFGLAKAFVGDAEDVPDSSQSPTLTKGTALGAIMGTASYMSPEQARGKPVDKRTDVWAFGCCLFEALTGRKAFDGDSAADVLGAIIHKEPNWSALALGPSRRLVELCLRKHKRERLQDIGDARIVLDITEEERTTTSPVAPLALALTAVAGIVVGAGLVALLTGDSHPPPAPKQFAVPLGESERLGEYFITLDNPVAWSPDGSHLAYAASKGSTSFLSVRDMSSGQTREVPGTTGATDPFFSPDGQWIGFFTPAQLNKVRVEGGEPEVITRLTVNQPGGASWAPEGSIVFSQVGMGLQLVSADGGEPISLTTRSPNLTKGAAFGAMGTASYRFPTFLPGYEHVLFTAGALYTEDPWLVVLDIESGEQTVLDELGSASSGVYLDTGHLAFARGRDLLVVPFDLSTQRPQGEPRLVKTGVFATSWGRSYFAVSKSGDLALVRGDATERSIVIVDRAGHEDVVASGQYLHPVFLNDANRLRVFRETPLNPWEFDIERETGMRSTTYLTSPDGARRILRDDGYWLESIDSNESPKRLEGMGIPSSWSHDGRWVAFLRARNIGVYQLDGTEPPQILFDSSYKRVWGVFSPASRYLAYVSDESGRDEVYVVTFPDTSQRWAVTNQECNQPLWWENEIFFRCGDRAMSLEVETDPVFRVVGEPELMFAGPYDHGENGDSHWDISPDGERFAMVRVHDASRPRQIEVVLNWFTELKRLVPAK